MVTGEGHPEETLEKRHVGVLVGAWQMIKELGDSILDKNTIKADWAWQDDIGGDSENMTEFKAEVVGGLSRAEANPERSGDRWSQAEATSDHVH